LPRLQDIVTRALDRYGEGSPIALDALQAFSSALWRAGLHPEALATSERVASWIDEAQGARSPAATEHHYNLLYHYAEAGDAEGARRQLRRLTWLEEASPKALTANQQEIREALPEIRAALDAAAE
ncbi:MAG: hypothetical protein AAF602_12580, partial [Myxococcota bacterium]